MRILLVWGAYLLLPPAAALAQTAPEELRKIARNPFAEEIKLSFEGDFTFNQGPYDRSANSLVIQPVIPLSITRDWLLVTRAAATAVTYQPNSLAKSGGSTHFGATTPSFFFTPGSSRTIILRGGPAGFSPQASSKKPRYCETGAVGTRCRDLRLAY